MSGHLTDLYLALGQIPGFDAPYLSALQEALDASGSPTPEAAIREAQAWASRWAESERAGLVFEESAPAWLAPLVEGDADPLPDPRPIPVVEEDAGPPADQDPDLEDDPEPPPTPVERWRDPWHSLSGERATTQRAQTKALESWTDPRFPEAAADHAETHDKLRARIRATAGDLRTLERIREGIGRSAPWPAVALEQIWALLARPRPIPTPAVRRIAEDLWSAIEAPEAPAAPDPEPAPADPRTRAAYLRQLAEESDREAARRRAEADALDPRPEEPSDLLASRVAALRVVLTEPSADLPDLIRIAGQTICQQTERLSAYNNAVGAAARAAPVPDPAEPPRWPARVSDAADAICELFRVDNPELDGELIEILMKLRSQRTTPPVLGATEPSSPPAGSGFAAAAELAAAVSTLRVEAGLGPIPEGELPEAIRAVLADRDLQIGGLKRDLKTANAEIEERDAEIAAAWTALGDAQGATIAEAIRSLLADRDRQIESQRAEIARLRAELDARPPRPDPAWHDSEDGRRFYGVAPVILAWIEPGDQEGVWTWGAGSRSGATGGPSAREDAAAIVALFLGAGS